jgi:uncharacterized protein (DUF1697 family)
MFTYVAFLRGINVGGRTVVKEQLRDLFASLGFNNISTYKQSGNVIFETDIEGPQKIRVDVETKLRITLNYEVKVFLRTIPQLKNIIDLNPFKGQKTEGTSFLVTFLPAAFSPIPLQLPLTIPKSTAQVILANETEVFSVTHGGGEGALPNSFLESKLKVKTTTRNLNIISEIVKNSLKT